MFLEYDYNNLIDVISKNDLFKLINSSNVVIEYYVINIGTKTFEVFKRDTNLFKIINKDTNKEFDVNKIGLKHFLKRCKKNSKIMVYTN